MPKAVALFLKQFFHRAWVLLFSNVSPYILCYLFIVCFVPYHSFEITFIFRPPGKAMTPEKISATTENKVNSQRYRFCCVNCPGATIISLEEMEYLSKPSCPREPVLLKSITISTMQNDRRIDIWPFVDASLTTWAEVYQPDNTIIQYGSFIQPFYHLYSSKRLRHFKFLSFWECASI